MNAPVNDGTLRVSLKALTVGSGLLALASLSALVITVSLRDVDILSVVALALAILAFTIQIIVFAIQAADAASGSRRSLELHAQLSALLSEVRERTGTTQKSVDSINGRLLEAVIGKTLQESKVDPSGIGGDVFAEQVAVEYARAAMSGSASEPPQVTPRMYPDALRQDEAEPIHSDLSVWPPNEDFAWINETVKKLSEDDLNIFVRIAEDAFTYTSPRSHTAPGFQRTSESLMNSGLTQKVPGWKLYTLTELGRKLARLFTAQGEVPEGFGELASRKEAVLRHIEKSRNIVNYRD